MKKFLFLIPLILLALNATPIALFKSSVNYVPNKQYFKLSPSYWKQTSLKVQDKTSFQEIFYDNNLGTQKLSTPLSKDAKTYGFPFDFYLKKSNVVLSNLPESTVTITAYSKILAVVDGLIIFITLIFAALINWKRLAPTKTHAQIVASQTVVG